jgi:hypothetical protein
MKTITFNKPRMVEMDTSSVDRWVGEPAVVSPVPDSMPLDPVPIDPVKPVEMKRFTIDVEVGLHTRIKSQCALRGKKMADLIRELLEREFPAD